MTLHDTAIQAWNHSGIIALAVYMGLVWFVYGSSGDSRTKGIARKILPADMGGTAMLGAVIVLVLGYDEISTLVRPLGEPLRTVVRFGVGLMWSWFVLIFGAGWTYKALARRVVGRLPKTDAGRPVVGLRQWRIARQNGEIRLKSLLGTTWKPGRPKTGDPTEPSQGVHAFKTTQQMVDVLGNGERGAYGTVALAGEIVEHENGYRAEFAYPMTVVVANKDDAHDIARTYGCETMVGATNANRRVIVETLIDPKFDLKSANARKRD